MKILIAEDDIDFGNILSQYVSISGFDVNLTRTGKEAWEKYSESKPDICVLDVMMPEMDGFTLAEKIKQSDPDMPLLFLTAKSLKEDIVKGLKIGADDYITKPSSFSTSTLPADIIFPNPLITSILFFLNRYWIPLLIPSATDLLLAMILEKFAFISPDISIP